MEVIVYAHPDNERKNELLKKVSQSVTPKTVLISNFERIFQLLRKKMSGKIIIVFLISSENELEYLKLVKSSFFNSRYIIILPDDRNALAVKSLSLQPRYLSYSDCGFRDVCAVLNKMIQNQNE